MTNLRIPVPQPSAPVTELEAVCPGPQSVVMKASKSLIPSGTYAIPVCNISKDGPVLVLPPTPSPSDPPENCWPPQVCDVVSGSAIYTNQSSRALCHAKGVHFKVVPMSPNTNPTLQPAPPSQKIVLSAASSLPQPPPSKLLSKIRINVDLLTPQQLERLHALHMKHATAFNEDLREGFRDAESPYRASFSFR